MSEQIGLVALELTTETSTFNQTRLFVVPLRSNSTCATLGCKSTVKKSSAEIQINCVDRYILVYWEKVARLMSKILRFSTYSFPCLLEKWPKDCVKVISTS